MIDAGAIERNCRRLGSELGPETALCAVVKADGYGHGAVPAAAAALAGGASWLAVAAAAEAVELRGELAERARLLVLGAMAPTELDLALGAGADLAVWRPGFLDLVAERGRELGIRPQVHVKYDTGMGRLGERDPEVVGRLARTAAGSPDVDLVGLWTHFATADETDAAFLDAAARPLPRSRPAAAGGARGDAARGQQRRDAARAARSPRHGPMRGRRSTASTPSASTRPRAGSSPRSSCARTSPM